MNYIDHDDLERISSLLTDLKIGSYIYNGKVEAFSSASLDSELESAQAESDFEIFSYLKTGVEIVSKLNQMAATSISVKSSTVPPNRRRSSSLGNFPQRKPKRRRASSLSDLSEPSTQHLLIKLIMLLNESFPNYDYGHVKLSQFTAQDVNNTINIVNSYLAEVTTVIGGLFETLWRSMDNILNLNRCEVFLFKPEIVDDFSFMNVWSFHYFFYNHDLKVLCHLRCSATSVLRKQRLRGIYNIPEDATAEDNEDLEDDEGLLMQDSDLEEEQMECYDDDQAAAEQLAKQHARQDNYYSSLQPSYGYVDVSDVISSVVNRTASTRMSKSRDAAVPSQEYDSKNSTLHSDSSVLNSQDSRFITLLTEDSIVVSDAEEGEEDEEESSVAFRSVSAKLGGDEEVHYHSDDEEEVPDWEGVI